MKNILLALFAVVAATSCSKYTVEGTSDMTDADGRMLFLRSLSDPDLHTLDSCDVVHGKFKFSGPLDSVQVAMLCFDDMAVLPIVLESGDIKVVLNGQHQECKGTPLNDTLTAFNAKYNQLMAQLEDLEHQQNQAIMNAEDMNVVNQRLASKAQVINQKEDDLVTGFIESNFDNVLGPYIFQIATQTMQYPQFTPWIEALMSKATDTFKNNPYVKDFMEAAQHNQDVQTGVVDPQPQMPPTQPLPQGPTPNQMAAPEQVESPTAQ